MSLILEALKKSEAERRLGQAPDLLATTLPHSRSRPRGWLTGFMIGLVAALLLACTVWWWLNRNTGQPPAGAATSVDNRPAAPAPAPAREPAPDPSRDIDVVVEPSPAARSDRMDGAVDRPATALPVEPPQPRDPALAVNERESAPVPADSLPPPTPPASRPEPRTDTPLRPDPAAIEALRPADDGIAAAAPPVPKRPEPAAAAEPELEALQHLATLPAAMREGLPPLRVSMHVYHAEPAARFVLIDGKRYRQGDSVANDVIVDEIRPDGVAIAYRGRRFLISRP